MPMNEKGPLLVDARRLETSLLELRTVYNARTGHVRVPPLRSSRSFPSRDQNRNNKRTEIEQFIWFIERIKTRVAFGWLSERSGEKTSCPRTFGLKTQHYKFT